MIFLLSLACIGTATGASVTITHYSDVQCPCSARVPQDMKQHFLDNPDFAGLVDFEQFFVGDLTKNVSKCIHGEGECVGQRHFACAQNMSLDVSNGGVPPYSKSKKWLNFEACSYGPCTNCAAILGPHCPCSNYTTFTDFEKNDLMKQCASATGLPWDELHKCGTSAQGQALMEASSSRSNAAGITYGVDGLAPLFVDGVKVKTKQLIPIVCGPIPKEVKVAVCAALKAKGSTPPACAQASSIAKDAPRVKIIQFTMAKCPMTTTWHVRFNRLVMQQPALRDIVDFEQSFVGGAIGEGPLANATDWKSCFHGESECKGHTVMLCAKNVSRTSDPFDYRWVDLVTCMDGPKGLEGVTYDLPISIPNNAEKCAEKVGLSWDKISVCASGAQGAQLLHDSHYRTADLFQQHGGYTPAGHGYRPPLIPSIWIEGKEYNDPLVPARNPYADLVQRVCDAYTGTKPAICSEMSDTFLV